MKPTTVTHCPILLRKWQGFFYVLHIIIWTQCDTPWLLPLVTPLQTSGWGTVRVQFGINGQRDHFLKGDKSEKCLSWKRTHEFFLSIKHKITAFWGNFVKLLKDRCMFGHNLLSEVSENIEKCDIYKFFTTYFRWYRYVDYFLFL